MGQWGDGPFDSDGGQDEMLAVIDRLSAQVEGIACGTSGDRSSVIRDEQELTANVEMLCLIARAAYRSAMFLPFRLLLPDAAIVREWRRKFIARYGRLAKKQLEGTLAELKRYAREAAAPLDRLAELSREQAEGAASTHLQLQTEANRRLAEEEGEDTRGLSQ